MPTIKQRRGARAFVKKITEKGGKSKSFKMGKLMENAGYSKSIQKNPHKITESKGWQSMLSLYLPKERIVKLVDKLTKEYEDAKTIKDKRSLLTLLDYLTKLHDLYPVQKSASIIRQYTEEVKDVFEAPEDKAPTEQPETE